MPVYIQPYELDALSEVGEVETMPTDLHWRRHYNARTQGGKKYMQRRVRAFAREKFIQVLPITLNTPKGPRKLPNVIRLLPKGADIVERLTGERPPREVRSDPPTLLILHHRVGVSRFVLNVKDACLAEGLREPQLILEQDMARGAKRTDPLDRQFVLFERFTLENQRLSCRPDASLAIELPGTPTPMLVAYLEYDRSTDKRQQIERKVLPYSLLLNPQPCRYRRHWPDVDNGFARVFFVTKSHERISNVCNWIRAIPGAKFFRFAVESEVDAGVLRNPIWRTVDGQRVAVLPTSTPNGRRRPHRNTSDNRLENGFPITT